MTEGKPMSDISQIHLQPELSDLYQDIQAATNHDIATIRHNLSYDYFQGDDLAFEAHLLSFRKAALAAEQPFVVAYSTYVSCRHLIVQNLPCHNKGLFLNLGGVQLSLVPPEIGLLINLVGLNLRGNHLASLPIEFEKLPHLQELNLVDNKIQSLPSCLLGSSILTLVLFDRLEENRKALEKLRDVSL